MGSTGGFIDILGETGDASTVEELIRPGSILLCPDRLTLEALVAVASAPRILIPSAHEGEGTATLGLPTDDLARDDLVDAMSELDLALALARRVIGILNQSLGFNEVDSLFGLPALYWVFVSTVQPTRILHFLGCYVGVNGFES